MQESPSVATTDNGRRDTPVSRFPVAEFRAAMEAGDVEKAITFLTDDCIARPLGADVPRFQGKDRIRSLWNAVLGVGKFTYGQELRSDDTIVILFDVEFSNMKFEAVDVLRIDEEGKCKEIFALARPYMPIALFTGRVAIAFAREGGIFRRLLTYLLVAPLEVSQRLGEPFGAWIVKGSMERGLRKRAGK
jgi:SnoaL-like domain